MNNRHKKGHIDRNELDSKNEYNSNKRRDEI